MLSLVFPNGRLTYSTANSHQGMRGYSNSGKQIEKHSET